MTSAPHSDPGTPPVSRTTNTEFSASDLADMSRLGIHHIAGNFLYQQYRYGKLADAVNYAKLDRSRTDQRDAVNVLPAWVPAAAPNNGDWRAMKELGITFDGTHYHFLNYRYDRFQDAINQADHMRRDHWAEERPPNTYF